MWFENRRYLYEMYNHPLMLYIRVKRDHHNDLVDPPSESVVLL